jgi:hypothetical protein
VVVGRLSVPQATVAAGKEGKWREGRGEPVPLLTLSEDDAGREIDDDGRRMATTM